MDEIKQVGRYGFAIGLWLAIIWIFTSPKRILIVGFIGFTSLFALALLSDDTGDLYYVNINKLELFDKPFGNKVKTLVMNDTLRMVSELNEDWIEVAIGMDTLYFKDRFTWHDDLGFWASIQREPFTMYKALVGGIVTLNHPDGYMEIGSAMYKNGDVLNVIDTYKNKLTIKAEGGSNVDIDVSYIDTDWDRIKRLYPLAQE